MIGTFIAALALSAADPFPPGLPPKPVDFDAVVHDRLRDVLRDADSAQVRLKRAPIPAHISLISGTDGPMVDGWAACYGVNGKNAYGAYVGEATYLFLVWGDKANVAYKSDATPGEEAEAVRAECARPAP